MFSLKKYLLQGGARAFSSSNGMRACIVDTDALMRRLVAEGFSSSQARAAAYTVKKVLDGTFEKVDNSFSTRSQFEKIKAVQKANIGNAIFEANTSMGQWARRMDEKIEKLRDDLDEELELTVLELKKKLNSMEFQRATKRNDAKYFVHFTVGTLLALGTFSFAIVRMLK